MASPYTQYASVHQSPAGPGDARPTALQIITDNDRANTLTDKVILITGTSSGIGVETARALKATGAHIFCTARNPAKARAALKDLLEPGKLDLLEMDNASLASVRACAAEFRRRSARLNVLVCNAGIMAVPHNVKTPDGFESHFGTNHLAHFLLFQLLRPALLASAAPGFHSRVVCVSSAAHRVSGVVFDDLGLDENYTPWTGYGQSKTANVYMATEIERRYGARGCHGYALMPGGIWTGLQVHVDTGPWRAIPGVAEMMKSVEQGAATTVWAAVGKVWEGKGGVYLEDCGVAGPEKVDAQLADVGYAKHAFDEEKEGRLWRVSCEMVGVRDE